MKLQSFILAFLYALSVNSAGTVALKPAAKPGTRPVVSGIHPTRPTGPSGIKPFAKPIHKGSLKPVSKVPTPAKTIFGMNPQQLVKANEEFSGFVRRFLKGLTKNEMIDFLNSRITALNVGAPTPAPKPVTGHPTTPPKFSVAKPIVKPAKKL